MSVASEWPNLLPRHQISKVVQRETCRDYPRLFPLSGASLTLPGMSKSLAFEASIIGAGECPSSLQAQALLTALLAL